MSTVYCIALQPLSCVLTAAVSLHQMLTRLQSRLMHFSNLAPLLPLGLTWCQENNFKLKSCFFTHLHNVALISIDHKTILKTPPNNTFGKILLYSKRLPVCAKHKYLFILEIRDQIMHSEIPSAFTEYYLEHWTKTLLSPEVNHDGLFLSVWCLDMYMHVPVSRLIFTASADFSGVNRKVATPVT